MTGKERAAFRAQANGLESLFQIGKGGISDAFIEQVEGALNKRELIKFKILADTSPVTAREAADTVAAAVGAEVIQVIGGVVVLYRRNPDLHKPGKTQKQKEEIRRRGMQYSAFVHSISKKERKDAANRKSAAARKRSK